MVILLTSSILICFALERFQNGKLVPNIPFQVLNAAHQVESETGCRGQLFDSQNDVSPVGEQGAVKVNTMESTKLEKPRHVVGVFFRNDSMCQLDN